MRTLWTRLLALTPLLLVSAPALAGPDPAPEGHGLYFLGAGIATGAACLGAGIGQGRACAAAVEGMARNPSAAPTIRTSMILGMVLMESLGLYGFLLGLMAYAG